MKMFLFTPLFLLSLFSIGCNSTKADTSAVPMESSRFLETEQEREIQLFTDGKVEFQGMSFKYNPQIFGDIEAEKINKEQPLGLETDKPHENFPKHIEFYFGKGSSNKGRIAVVPIAEHRKMYAVSKSLTRYFDENHRDLQKVLKDKDFRVKGEIPFVPFYDAHQAIVAQVKHISFQNGKAVCFLTQYEQETSLINNEGLSYYCQGVTSDNNNYFLAVFPVEVSFLPKDIYVNEFEGYKIPEAPWNISKDEKKQYLNYISKITKRLENLSPKEFEPNLTEFENIISSLKIEK